MKKSKKNGGKGSVALCEGVFSIGLRVPRVRTSKEVFLSEERKIGTNSHRHILQRDTTLRENAGKEGCIARSYSKV